MTRDDLIRHIEYLYGTFDGEAFKKLSDEIALLENQLEYKKRVYDLELRKSRRMQNMLEAFDAIEEKRDP